MKLVRIGEPGAERPAVLVSDDHAVDVADIVDDFDESFFATDGPLRIQDSVKDRKASGKVFSIAGLRLGAPIARPHQILCVGLNYSDHANESGMTVPTEPVVFSKSPNTLVGPGDDIVRPPAAWKLDYEVELGVIIGKRSQYLSSKDEALQSIAGFTLVNDVSEREFQLEREGQWIKGKSCATFNPCGPYLVTPDEVSDPQDLDLWLEVNGQRRQSGTTADMIFDVATIIQYLSQFFVLEPGDLINTGTPPGVALGMNPPQYLEPGDLVTLGGGVLGEQRSQVVTFEDLAETV
ncbi:fumarylacetoacetate hydrolase family protein [Rhodococcus sp. NPDC059968]|uniref:fumarylacetoacetate hydrolase family protein n=1 Tax=Rhodococcus sp. NPDC059968 TaxID=3347017 RepID=UPI00366BCA9B